MKICKKCNHKFKFKNKHVVLSEDWESFWGECPKCNGHINLNLYNTLRFIFWYK